MRSDTIAAVATGMGHSGIGIIRISGKDALSIASAIFRPADKKLHLSDVKSHTIHYGFLFDGNALVDEVMVSVMKEPRSYTAEDTVEINCHGNSLIMNRVLELVIRQGARLAEPGEFTKRAFLNGRINLSEAEAVMDVISAESERSLTNSLRQLKGSLSEKIIDLRGSILYEIAYIESVLDDPEHYSFDHHSSELSEKIDFLTGSINTLISSFEKGKLLKEGINTVIIGKPNVGKSSLLNILVGEDKAIVTDVAGTTRDVLEQCISLNGISLNIIDTAGIRFTEDIVEKIGVEKAKKTARDADLIVYVADSSVELNENDFEILKLIEDKKVIVLLNKTDLESRVEENDLRSRMKEDTVIIKTSTRKHTGIDEFEKEIERMFFDGKICNQDEVMITNLRHSECLAEALESLEQVKKSIDKGMPEDFYSIDLMDSYEALGFITGETVNEDLSNEIFDKFCMGK